MPPTISTKMVVNTPKAIFCGTLTPNTRMNTGRKIDLGTPNRKFTRGRRSAPSTGSSASRKPMPRPTGNASRKAASTSHAVTPKLASTSRRPRSWATAWAMTLGAGTRPASRRPARARASHAARRPRIPAATMRRSRRRMARLRPGRRDRHGHEDLGGGRHVLEAARRRELHGLLDGGERHLPVAREAEVGLLELHLGDVHRQLVVGGDGLDRVVGVGAQVLESAVERVQALQDEGAPLVQVLVGGRP